MAGYVEFLMSEDRWTELKPQLERNDNGNSHHRTLDVYTRLLTGYRRLRAAGVAGSAGRTTSSHSRSCSRSPRRGSTHRTGREDRGGTA